MSEWINAALLGLVEGVTEFLPVSSTGHLLITEHFLGKHYTDLFNVVIQTGAVLAVLAIFWKRVQELLTRWQQPETRDYVLKLGVAFVITAVGGLALKHFGMKLPKEIGPIAWATLIGGILFVLIEWQLKSRRTTNDVTWAIAIAFGLAQLVAAAFPGASRSGTTILFALALGLARPAAVEFSFLLGIPTLLAAGAKEAKDAIHDHTPHESWSIILFATVVAAVTAFVVVKWLIGYVRNHTFTPFGIYRIVVGGALLAWAMKH
ncbi:MAG TPA: undecaprenyl-diphosphate phosphatase [Candidatus Limnocylindria bacterium]|jgi:undecaprenyl-diphosphatase|nr:undecaprenyl-diphosphate phosphatase [Candidatus Limnocylindria bacterium]